MRIALGLLVVLGLTTMMAAVPYASRPLVIATSPAVKEAITALGEAFERSHPDVRVQVAVDTSLGSGPIHLVAPGGDELINRLEQKYYVLPGAKALYATEQLVLVAPESLSEAPESFQVLAQMEAVRIAVADRTTRLGVETDRLLSALGLKEKQIDVASDQAGILDHVLNGQADVGIMFGHGAMRVRERVRIVAAAPTELYVPVPHSIAMERYCPDRQLCEEFLQFVISPEGQAALKRLGYGPGRQPRTPVHVQIP
jgi:molybdate transport system substrate-binding protein